MTRVLRTHASHKQARKSLSTKVSEDGWAVRSAAGLEILTAKICDSLPWIVHGFSTRKGGVSQLNGAAVLNLGFTDWDSAEAVMRNRGTFVRAVFDSKSASNRRANRAIAESLITLQQRHSDVMHVFEKAPVEAPQGDAALCRQAGLLLGIQTADCVPILLADPRGRVVGAVHAGWRGTLARIVTKTIGRMRLEFGARPEDVIAVLGPAIGPCCYEVGPEVAQAFSAQFSRAAEWFAGPFERLATGEEANPLPWLTMMPPGHEPPPERVRLDLRAANRWQLVEAGIKAENIVVSALCTGCRSDLFFSYRKEGAGAGRMMSVIGIAGRPR